MKKKLLFGLASLAAALVIPLSVAPKVSATNGGYYDNEGWHIIGVDGEEEGSEDENCEIVYHGHVEIDGISYEVFEEICDGASAHIWFIPTHELISNYAPDQTGNEGGGSSDGSSSSYPWDELGMSYCEWLEAGCPGSEDGSCN